MNNFSDLRTVDALTSLQEEWKSLPPRAALQRASEEILPTEFALGKEEWKEFWEAVPQSTPSRSELCTLYRSYRQDPGAFTELTPFEHEVFELLDALQESRDRVKVLHTLFDQWKPIEDGSLDGRKRVSGKWHYAALGKVEYDASQKEMTPEQKKLTRDGVLGLISQVSKSVQEIYHLSDCISHEALGALEARGAGQDLSWLRIQNHYSLLARILESPFTVKGAGSTPGHSLHTSAHALMMLGQNAKVSHLHGGGEFPIHICVNNADRSKHVAKENAAGSQCLYARVLSPTTGVHHTVVGVDHESFALLKPYITDLYVVEGIPGHPTFSDISKGSQFRSCDFFPVVHALVAASGGGLPAGFRTYPLSLDVIPDVSLAPNELLLCDRDHFGNHKLLSAYENGVVGVVQHLGIALDAEELEVVFSDPETDEVLGTHRVMPTEYLGKHTGKACLWNGSSRTPEQSPFVELGISKGKPDDQLSDLFTYPIGTKVVCKRYVG